MSLYHQWHADQAFAFEWASDDTFVEHLLAGRVSEFDLTQYANYFTTYTRCFFRLQDSNTVYQATPFTRLLTTWRDGPRDRRVRRADADRWAYVYAHFTCTEADCQVRFVRRS